MKIFVNHISDKRLIFKIYKEPLQLNSKKNKYSWPLNIAEIRDANTQHSWKSAYCYFCLKNKGNDK